MGAAASAEDQYKQAGHAAADQAEAGADKLTQQVGSRAQHFHAQHFLLSILVVTCSHAGVSHYILPYIHCIARLARLSTGFSHSS